MYQDLLQPLRAYTVWFDVAVRDSTLDLRLLPGPGSAPPVVSAIEVTKSKWSWLGGGPLEAGTAVRDRPALAVDSSNRPVVAWVGTATDSPNNNVLVARWTGSAYQRLGGPLGNYRKNGVVDVVREQSGAWVATSNSGLKGWSSVPTVDVQMGAPLLRIDSAGTPVVLSLERAWGTSSGRFIRKWNGTAWAPLENRYGPIDTTFINGILMLDGETDMAFALNTSGQPVVAIPEEPLAGTNYGYLRLRTFTP